MKSFAQAYRIGVQRKLSEIDADCCRRKNNKNFPILFQAVNDLCKATLNYDTQEANADHDATINLPHDILDNVLDVVEEMVRNNNTSDKDIAIMRELVDFAVAVVGEDETHTAKHHDEYSKLLKKLNDHNKSMLLRVDKTRKWIGNILLGIGLMVGIGLIIAATLPIFPITLAVISVPAILYFSGIMASVVVIGIGSYKITVNEKAIKDKKMNVNLSYDNQCSVLSNAHTLFKNKQQNSDLNAVYAQTIPAPRSLSSSEGW